MIPPPVGRCPSIHIEYGERIGVVVEDLLTSGDIELTVKLAGCSLAETPGKDNWVDKAGGLPEYICEIARSIKKSGKTTSQAIAIAVSRVKKWAAGGDGVDPDTVAKASKAVAQWEKLKAKSASKDVVKASREDGSEYLILSNVSSYSMDRVREAFNAKERERRELIDAANDALRAATGNTMTSYKTLAPVPCDYRYVREVWTDFLIVENDSGKTTALLKVPYTVTDDGTVSWGQESPVVQEYVDVAATTPLGRMRVALSAGRTDPRPGKQVVSSEGAKKFGKPIGANLGTGTSRYKVGDKVQFAKNGAPGVVIRVGKPAINGGTNEASITWAELLPDGSTGGHNTHRESMLEPYSETTNQFAKMKAAAEAKKGSEEKYSAAKIGPNNAKKIAAAEAIHGAGSAEHQEAIKQYGKDDMMSKPVSDPAAGEKKILDKMLAEKNSTAPKVSDLMSKLKAAPPKADKDATDATEAKNQKIRDLTASINKVFPKKDGGQHPNFSLTREELEARLKQNVDAGPKALNSHIVAAYKNLIELLSLKSAGK